MTAEHIIAFNLALIVAIASPGPALLVAIQTTLRVGRAGGIIIGCGLGLMASTWTLAALLGLEAVFRLFPWVYATVRTLGAIYLLYLAWRIWKGARSKVESGGTPTHRLFWQGILINALNPKSVLFAAAVLVVIFPPGMSLVENSIIVLNHFMIEVLFYTALAFGMGIPVIRSGYFRSKVYIDRTASVVLGALGLRLLASR